MIISSQFGLCLIFGYLCVAAAYFGQVSESELKDTESCFCQLKGKIDDCSCNVDTVDYFNNVKIFPRLKSLLTKDYFRYYKVNLKKQCPFWSDDSRCAIRFCHVEACSPQDVPPGIKGYNENRHDTAHATSIYSEEGQQSECNSDVDQELGFLDTTISAASYEEFERWQAHDSAMDSFCDINDNGEEAEYVDLLLNPERYTGYKGKSAHRVWHTIYKENCFLPPNSYGPYIQSAKLNGLCLEKRAFYRVVSGLHTSINIHLCANYLLQDATSGFGLANPGGTWGANRNEFVRRFSPEGSGGEGPQWLRNLYFLYLLELRALAKAANILNLADFYTGRPNEDNDLRMAVQDLLSVIRSFPEHFDESTMFTGGEAVSLKRDFQEHFRNISRVMDCVGCDKCKLWGKLQVTGVGTALKILFSPHIERQGFLRRGEIVALFNSFGRLSNSINELEMFRAMVR